MSLIRDLVNGIVQLFRWWFIVSPWEQAVRVRLGRWVCVLGAGIHLKIPWVDLIYLQPTRRRISLVPMQTVTTLDGKTVSVSGSLGYIIEDLLLLYQTIHDAEDTLQFMTMGHVADFVISRDLEDCTAEDLQAHVNSKLDLRQFGLGEQEFRLVDFAAVRTYRFLQAVGRNWKIGDELDTANPRE